MAWEMAFRSPITVEGSDVVLATLQDAADLLRIDDEETVGHSALRAAKIQLRRAASRGTGKDLSAATVATLKVLRAAGLNVTMDTSASGSSVSKPKMPTPEYKPAPSRSQSASQDIQVRLRELLDRGRRVQK